MKTWIIVVLILLFLFVVVPLVIYGITVRNLRKASDKAKYNYLEMKLAPKPCDNGLYLSKPPIGKRWSCDDGTWVLVNA